MKLTEARYSGTPEVYWIQNLEWNAILEYDNVPFVDPKTGVIVIAADGNYEDAYVNIHTFKYDEMKNEIPWAVEIAGSRHQINQFLDLYFPHWEEKQLNKSEVWDAPSLQRVIDHVTTKPKPTEKRDFSWMGEQVERIIEARYHLQPTPLEAFDAYEEFFEANKQTPTFDNVIIVDVAYEDMSMYSEENCYAALFLWVFDSTIDNADKSIRELATYFKLPFNDINIDPGVLKGMKDFKYRKLHCSLTFVGRCDTINEAKLHKTGEIEDLTEAKYSGTNLSTKDVLKIYEEIEKFLRDKNPEHHPYYDLQDGTRVTFLHPSIDTKYNKVPTAEFGILIHRQKNQKEANTKLAMFIEELNIPYNSIVYGQYRAALANKYGFIIQYRNPTLDK